MFGEVKQVNYLLWGKNRHRNWSFTHFTIAIANPRITITKWRREMRFRTSLQNTV